MRSTTCCARPANRRSRRRRRSSPRRTPRTPSGRPTPASRPSSSMAPPARPTTTRPTRPAGPACCGRARSMARSCRNSSPRPTDRRMETLSHWYGRLLDALTLLACFLLLLMTLLIGADVLLRNVGLGGIAPSNELSEDIIYLVTLLAAPGLLRQGQHIRV